MVIFFFASAAASSAYLTVSETFPLEMRALAIAFFYAVGTGVGGVAGPWLFGALIDTGSRMSVFGGYLLGAVLMIVGGARRLALGRRGRAQAAGSGGAAADVYRLSIPSRPQNNRDFPGFIVRCEGIHSFEIHCSECHISVLECAVAWGAGDADSARDYFRLPCIDDMDCAGAARRRRQRPDKVSFYFAAHEDDWQLFMNPSAFQDVINGAAKTVFIHMTAGDAGARHRLGRPQASVLSGARKRRGDRDPLHGRRRRYPGRAKSSSTGVFNGHSIYRVVYRNTVSYFLRVPDGNPQGTGYYDTGFQSLSGWPTAPSTGLTAVDGSTVYHGWNDLTATRARDRRFRTRPRGRRSDSTSPSSMPASTRTTTPII